jgi:hypothetical protein
MNYSDVASVQIYLVDLSQFQEVNAGCTIDYENKFWTAGSLPT